MHRDIAGRDDALSIEQALAMATRSGPSLGRPGQLGRVAEGPLADLVLLDTASPYPSGHRPSRPSARPARSYRRRRHGDRRGRVVVEHGDLVGVDDAALADTARQARMEIAVRH